MAWKPSRTTIRLTNQSSTRQQIYGKINQLRLQDNSCVFLNKCQELSTKDFPITVSKRVNTPKQSALKTSNNSNMLLPELQPKYLQQESNSNKRTSIPDSFYAH